MVAHCSERVFFPSPFFFLGNLLHVCGASGSSACKELLSQCLRNLFLTLVVRYLVELSTTLIPAFFFLFWRQSAVSSYSPGHWSFLFPHCCMMLTACWEVSSLDLITLKTFHCFSNQSRMLDHTAVLALGGSHSETTAIMRVAPFARDHFTSPWVARQSGLLPF